MYIVLEYLIIENFIINFLILKLTKIITRSQSSIRRMIFGAFIASTYTLAYFLPFNSFLLSAIGKMLFAMVIIGICFKYINYKIFFKTIVAFYITSFIFAGATIGTFFAQSSGYVSRSLDFGIEGFPIKLLIIGVLISFIGGKIIFKYFNIIVMKENCIADVKIYYNNKEIQIKALLDTGNSLKEPITKRKVMIVDYKVLEDLLPIGVKDLIIANDTRDYLKIEKQLDLLKDDFLPIYIPYKSVGGSSTIIGFAPDFIEIEFNGFEKTSKDIIIGIYSGSLTNDVGYSGLLNFEMNWGDFDEVSEIQS